MLSNPKFSCHLGNFLCFQRNPIRILLTGKSNKNSIYTRRQRSEVMKWKLACFKRAHFERRLCHKRARESFAKWTFQQYVPWEGNFSHYFQIWHPFSELGFPEVKRAYLQGDLVFCSFLWEEEQLLYWISVKENQCCGTDKKLGEEDNFGRLTISTTSSNWSASSWCPFFLLTQVFLFFKSNKNEPPPPSIHQQHHPLLRHDEWNNEFRSSLRFMITPSKVWLSVFVLKKRSNANIFVMTILFSWSCITIKKKRKFYCSSWSFGTTCCLRNFVVWCW